LEFNVAVFPGTVISILCLVTVRGLFDEKPMFAIFSILHTTAFRAFSLGTENQKRRRMNRCIIVIHRIYTKSFPSSETKAVLVEHKQIVRMTIEEIWPLVPFPAGEVNRCGTTTVALSHIIGSSGFASRTMYG
jgi:hypothetical protein